MIRPPPRETALGALGASLGDVPPTVSVAWTDGRQGPVVGREELSPEALAGAVRRHLAAPWPRGEGTALIPARLRPGATSHGAGDALAVSMLHLDHDVQTLPLAAAVDAIQELGLECHVFPSPSADWPGALKWRGLVTLAHPVPAEGFPELAALGLAVFSAALGCALDGSVVRNPGGLAFLHPARDRGRGPRPPEALVHLRGRALDLGALGAHAESAGWWSIRAARDARGVCDPDLVLSAVREAGLILGTENRRGYVPTGCPLEHQHATSRVGGSLAMLHVATGAWRCLSDHSLAPPGERGQKGTLALLRALAAQRPHVAPLALGALDSGLLSKVREALAKPPPGEPSRRVVSLAGVPDEVLDAHLAVYRDGRTVLLTPPPGSGKSHSAGLAHLAAFRALPRITGPASSLHVVGDREGIAAACASILAAGLEPREHRPVHLFVAPDGEPVCRYHVRAEELYRQGASARESLCAAVPGEGTCPAIATCRARNALVPWALVGGRAVVTLDEPDPARQWVMVATSAAVPAAAQALGAGRPVIVDESDPALTPVVRVLRADDLALAVERAERLRPASVHRGWWRPRGELTAGNRDVARALATRAAELGPVALASTAPLQRQEWALSVLDALLSNDPQAMRNVRAWCDPSALAGLRPCDVADVALRQWIERPGVQRVMVADRPGRARLDPAGGEALEALAWWLDGAETRGLPPDEDTGPGVSVTRWPPVVRDLLRAGHPALCLDATGDPRLTLAAIGGDPSRFEHRPLGVECGAEVRRAMVVSGRCGRRALAPRGEVHWENALRILTAGRDVLGALLGAGERPTSRGGVAFTTRPLAVTLWSLAAGQPPEEHPSWTKLSERQREALRRSLDAAPPAVHKVLASIAVLGAGADPPVEWVWWGATTARGANVYQGRAWALTLGDPRAKLDTVRDALRAYGSEPSEDTLRAELDARAGREIEQAHGRLRALQREGEVLAMAHVGRVIPHGWYERRDVTLVTPRTAARWTAPPAVRRVPLGPVAAAPPEALDAPHAHPAVREALRAWSPAELGAATGVSSEAVRSWRHGTRSPEDWRIDLLWSVVRTEGRGWGRAAIRRCIDARGEPAVRAEVLSRWDVRVSWESLTAWWEGRKGRPGTLAPRTEARLLAILPAVAVTLGVDVGRAPLETPEDTSATRAEVLPPAVGDGVVSMEPDPSAALPCEASAPGPVRAAPRGAIVVRVAGGVARSSVAGEVRWSRAAALLAPWSDAGELPPWREGERVAA